MLRLDVAPVASAGANRGDSQTAQDGEVQTSAKLRFSEAKPDANQALRR